MKKIAILAFCSSLSAVFSPWGLAEDNPSQFFVLVDSEKVDVREASQVIKLQPLVLISKLSDKQLRFELDSIDITLLMHKEEAHWLFQPIKPLSSGQHRLVISVSTSSGNQPSPQSIEFSIVEAKSSEQLQVAMDTQATINYRFSDNQLPNPPPNSIQKEVISQLSFSSTQGNWLTQGEFDLYYTSVKDNRPSDRTVENGEFLLSISNGDSQIQLGHQNMESANLVMDNFRRRGISMQTPIVAINGKITGYSLSSFDISGFGKGVGTTHASRRVDGISFSSSPIDTTPELLLVSGTWLTARSFESADFLFDSSIAPTGANKNDAWSVTGQSNLLEGKLQIGMEYAKSQFDVERLDSQPDDKDKAYQINALYSDTTEQEMTWSLGISKQKVGTFFQSLANQTLASDNDLFTAMGSMEWQTISLQSQFNRQKNNVNHLQDIATIQTDLLSVAANWMPSLETDDSWLGTPSFSLSVADQQQSQSYTPINYALPIADNQLKTWQLSGDFSYEQNAWGIGLSETQFRDYSLVQSNSDNLSLSFYGNLFIDPDISLAPAISFDKIDDLSLNTNSTSISYSLQSAFVLVPDVLTTAVSFVYTQDQTSDQTVDGNNMAANLSLSWLVSEANPNEFGIQLDFSAVYNDFKDRIWTANNSEAFQSYLTLTATLPSRIGQPE
ncbi:MAG: hypothetical protein Q9M92_03790 [Enterobacterales bacterium]|nr:hypothetical protein [Enterobacterales bacterium]